MRLLYCSQSLNSNFNVLVLVLSSSRLYPPSSFQESLPLLDRVHSKSLGTKNPTTKVTKLQAIKTWLVQPNVWSSVFTVVGFACYAFGAWAENLLGPWNSWKVMLYVAVGCIACLLLWTVEDLVPTYPRSKAKVVFWIFFIRLAYSFLFYNAMESKRKGKTDAFDVVASFSFAVMFYGLTKMGHLCCEKDLVYFFYGHFALKLMRMDSMVMFGTMPMMFIYKHIRGW